ncbi:RNA polymerase sigma factor [Yinghuangia seranimata]|uniref:RNA polymerase sigma factor n=1 Tax=Yinghuangia seranimata TaxID=408067 RepID=UPI00248C736E|nr:RNA polymerase sigma factor [Yinghuangia seranimata]MDI2125974.1 RNA polymerase sigma factor [Yinghuangia seranimata]
MTHQRHDRSDADLWQQIAVGDREAFGALFDRHAGAVYGHLLRRTGEHTEAEDLTSAVFLAAWRRRGEITLDRDSALPWLLGTANHTLANRRRALRRYRDLVERTPAPPDVPDHADDVAARLDAEQQARALRRSVGRLPRHERDVVELCVWGGLDQQAAAAALGVSVGTVKSRMHRARKRLGTLVPEELERNP